MPFTSLSSRPAPLPDVLVGPVLRLVRADQVNVFFACSRARKVTLEVFPVQPGNTPGPRVMAGTRSTTKLANKLHVVCVTATGAQDLQPDTLYCYDAKVGDPGSDATEAPGTTTLLSDGAVRELGTGARSLLTYAGGPALPSFIFPPDDVGDLRILHGSCRKPHGEGKDALATGDDLVAASFASGGPQRPHQLFLTGDQIYADDVAMALLHMLVDAAKPGALGFPEEALPLKAGPKPGKDIAPGTRKKIVGDDAGLTSSDSDSHLMTFAEYALMYVFAWSDALWPGLPLRPDDPTTVLLEMLPSVDDVFQAEWRAYKADIEAYALSPDASTEPQKDWRFLELAKQIPHLAEFKAALAKVRRLLANTPTLMIFDDHEITDDWNLNLAWEKRVYDPAPPTSRPTALGRAIIRNGLAAYAVFQAWGNTPEQFAAVTPEPPGTKLLGALDAWDGTAGTGAAAPAAVISTCVGIPDAFGARKSSKPTGALTWFYAHRWAQHEVVVLDTRTERGAADPVEPEAPPALIYDGAMIDTMARRTPALDDADMLVIAIAPGPAFGVPLHEATARYIHLPSIPVISPRVKANPGMDPEHWALTPFARERLLSALLSRPPADAGGVVRRRVVLLGGDVHHASAVRVRYHALLPLPLGVAGPRVAVEGVVAQLTSSALKNEDAKTYLIEKLGFMTTDQAGLVIAGLLLPVTEVNGWDNPTEAKKTVGTESRTTPAGSFGQRPIRVEGNPALYEFTYAAMPGPTPPPNASGLTYELATEPDWHYEVRPQRGLLVDRGAAQVIPTGPTTREGKVARAAAAAQQHRRAAIKLGSAQEVVGHTNIGDLTFTWGAGDAKSVAMDLWFRPEEDDPPKPFTHFEVELTTDPDGD